MIRLPVRPTEDRHAYGRLNIDPATGKPVDLLVSRAAADDGVGALATAHEIGHYLDRAASRWPLYPSGIVSDSEATPEMRALMNLIRRSPTYLELPVMAEFAGPRELWARAYAQYVAWRSGSSILKSRLTKYLPATILRCARFNGRMTSSLRSRPQSTV